MHHYWKNKIKSTHLESLLNYKQSAAEDEDRLCFSMVFYNLPWTWSVQFLQCKLHLFDWHSSWWVWNFWHRSGWWSCVAGKCQQNNEAKHNMSCYAMLFENENQLDTSLVFFVDVNQIERIFPGQMDQCLVVYILANLLHLEFSLKPLKASNRVCDLPCLVWWGLGTGHA